MSPQEGFRRNIFEFFRPGREKVEEPPGPVFFTSPILQEVGERYDFGKIRRELETTETFRRAERVLDNRFDAWLGSFEIKNPQVTSYLEKEFILFVAFSHHMAQSQEKPTAVAGFGLQQITALVRAKAISFEDGVRLFQANVEGVAQVANHAPLPYDTMRLAVPDGLTSEEYERRCNAFGIALRDIPDEISRISVSASEKDAVLLGGQVRYLEEVEQWLNNNIAGHGLSVKFLNIGIPLNTSTMQPVADSIARVVDQIAMRDAAIPVVATSTGRSTIRFAGEIRRELILQAISAIQWERALQTLENPTFGQNVRGSIDAVVYGIRNPTPMQKAVAAGAAVVGATYFGPKVLRAARKIFK